jgi:hypothetical protein
MKAKKRTYLVKDFLAEFDWAAKDFYEKKGRGFEQFLHGASVHFHERFIGIVRKRGGHPSRWIGEEPYFVELLYAMLASWGMERRGSSTLPSSHVPSMRSLEATCSDSSRLQPSERLTRRGVIDFGKCGSF